METNFSRKTINTYIYLKIPLVTTNKSVNMQVHNEGKLPAESIPKATVVFFLDLLGWKNLYELKQIEYG